MGQTQNSKTKQRRKLRRETFHEAAERSTRELGVFISAERLRYAAILKHGVRVSLTVLVATYLIYITRLMPPRVAPGELAQYWHLPADRYTEVLGIPHGWGWLGLLNHGDFLNFIGIAMLGLLTVVAFLNLLPSYLAKRNWAFAGIVALQVIVLLAAASGVLDMAE